MIEQEKEPTKEPYWESAVVCQNKDNDGIFERLLMLS